MGRMGLFSFRQTSQQKKLEARTVLSIRSVQGFIALAESFLKYLYGTNANGVRSS